MKILLVHGTFAQRAEWTAPESALHNALLSSDPAAKVSAFPWSGKNSHRARVKGGDELVAVLKECIATDPSEPIVVIAHSHGGTIALYALRKLENDPQTTGHTEVICLNTPIQSFTPRRMKPLQAAIHTLSAFINLFGPSWLIVQGLTGITLLNPLSILFMPEESSVSIVSIICYLGLAIPGMILSGSLVNWLFRSAHSHAQELALTLGVPKFAKGVLAIRTVRDEVPWYLRIWAVFSNWWPAFPVIALLAGLVAALSVIGMVGVTSYGAESSSAPSNCGFVREGFPCSTQTNAYYGSTSDALMELAPPSVFFGFLVTGFQALLLFLLFTRSTPLSFGDFVLSALLLKVRIVEPGKMFGFEADMVIKIINESGLSHSSVTGSPLCTQEVVRWISRKRDALNTSECIANIEPDR